MTAAAPVPGWEQPVIRFLQTSLPRSSGRPGWDHQFSTAYQIGVEALAALGHAEETETGAIPVDNPRLPEQLSRWDDVAVAVLWLAEQRFSLDYRLADGSRPQRGVTTGGVQYTQKDRSQTPPPNITAAHRLGPARAAPEVLDVLSALGLIGDGRWTPEAEVIQWRGMPPPWGLDFTQDARFTDAVDRALASLPDDIDREMADLTTINDADVEDMMRKNRATRERLHQRSAESSYLSPPLTREAALRSLSFLRSHALNALFFRRWRLADDWLTPAEAQRALFIFHDDLAIAMRRAVMAQLYPDVAFAAQ